MVRLQIHAYKCHASINAQYIFDIEKILILTCPRFIDDTVDGWKKNDKKYYTASYALLWFGVILTTVDLVTKFKILIQKIFSGPNKFVFTIVKIYRYLDVNVHELG